MIYVRQPTDAERAELKRMTRQEVGRVGQRAQMVLLSAQHRTVPEIAALFETSRGTVRQWLRRFGTDGPAGLRDEPRSGRPRTVTPQAEADLARWLNQDPQRVDAP
jgi:transposase